MAIDEDRNSQNGDHDAEEEAVTSFTEPPAADLVDEAVLEARFREQFNQKLVQAEEIVEEQAPSEGGLPASASARRTILIVIFLLGGIVVATILGVLIPRSEDIIKDSSSSSSFDVTLSRQSQFQNLLAPHVSDESLWEDTSSPQFQALNWLVDQDELMLDAGDEMDHHAIIERYAMMVLYYSTDGPNSWSDRLLFGTNYTTCEWPNINQDRLNAYTDNEVQCDDDNRIIKVRIDMNRLNGTIPAELSMITRLQILSLAGSSDLRGTLPSEIGRLARLNFFQTTGSSISGTLPSEISNLTEITVFAMFRNQLTGTVPDISTWSNLEVLDLATNYLEGTLPEIDADIRLLYVDDNSFEGTIPTSYWLSTNMETMSISSNAISGSLPEDVWGNFGVLQAFFAENNQLEGSLPEAIGSISSLRTLFLKNNLDMTGSIPAAWGNLRQLQWLDVSGMKLLGPLPSELGQLDQLQYLDLFSNPTLTGTVPGEWVGMESLERMFVHGTSLEGGFEESFCSLNGLTTSIRADCGSDEELCSCCTDCCTNDSSIGEGDSITCEVKLPALCETYANKFESADIERNTTCACLDGGARVECTDQSCPACNLAGDLCAMNTQYGYSFNVMSGRIDYFHNTIEYVSGRYDGMTIEMNIENQGSCEAFLNGEKCRDCSGMVCISGFRGWRVFCDNVEDGGNHNTCEEFLDQGPLEILMTFDKGFLSGCPLLLERIAV